MLIACARPANEEALRATIDRMQEAAEARDTAGIMELVADDFAGREFNDPVSLRRYLTAMFLQNSTIGITRLGLSVQMFGERATVNVRFLATGSNGSFFPERAEGISVDTAWRVVDGEWRMMAANLRQ
jgi:hypothetical protein